MRFIRSPHLSDWMATSTTWSLEHKSFVQLENRDQSKELHILSNKQTKVYKFVGEVAAQYENDVIHREESFVDTSAENEPNVDVEYARYLSLEHLQDIVVEDLYNCNRYRNFVDDLSDREKMEGHWLNYEQGEYRFIVDRFLIHDILIILVIDENALSLKLEVYQLNK